MRIKFRNIFFITFLILSGVSNAQNIPDLLKRVQTEKNKDSLIIVYDGLGHIYAKNNEFKKAIEWQKKALELNRSINKGERLAFSYNNLGTVYMQIGNLNEAIVYYTEALKILEANNAFDKAAILYGNIGNIYIKLKMYDKAFDFFNKGLELKKKMGDKNIIPNLYSISNVYRAKEMPKEALPYLNEANTLIDTTNPAQAKQRTMILNGLGACYRALSEYEKAAAYYVKSESLIPKTDLDRLAALYSNLSALYEYQEQYRKSLYYQLKSYDINKKSDNADELLLNYKNFVIVYTLLNVSDSAREFFSKYTDLSDSVAKMQNAEIALELNTKYETEKKENQIKLLAKDKELQSFEIIEQNNELLIRDIEAMQRQNEIKLLNKDKDIKEVLLQQEIMNKEKKGKENELLNVENKLSQQTISQQKTISYFIIAALMLASGLAFFIFRGLKIQRSANKIISAQKTEVETQKNLVEEKQKEILDSIHYAKRIQNTLLAHLDFLNENIENNFVLFKPKDIVSGDFYWATKKEHLFYLAVCDSTGHGVPGAFMSLLNMGFLSEAINEKDILEPHKILNYVRQRLIDGISKEGQKDGFDGILLCIDHKTKKMIYSAAHNAPIIIRNGEIIELAKDKMPVGIGERKESFTLHEIELQKTDSLYLYTDGYADQFGGPKGKKFLYKRLNELLSSLNQDDIYHRGEKLDFKFNEWKGALEQVDDVLVIGIKI